MRLLKGPFLVVAAGVLLLLLGGLGAWQMGWLDSFVGTASAPRITNPADLDAARAAMLAAEIQRLREELGETDIGKRRAETAARVKPLLAAPWRALAELRTQRAVLAERYFAKVDAALANPQWPSGAKAFEGDARFYAAKARDLLHGARDGFVYAQAADMSAVDSLNDAAAANAIAHGETTRPMPFTGLDIDARQALADSLPASIDPPARGTKPTPPTALPVPGLN